MNQGFWRKWHRWVGFVAAPFLLRLHSGEAWGDGGLVVAMFWGLALIFGVVSGVVIYLKMRRPGPTGLRRVIWLLPPAFLAAWSQTFV